MKHAMGIPVQIHMARCCLALITAVFIVLTLTLRTSASDNSSDDTTSDVRTPLKLSFLGSVSGEARLFAGAFFVALDHVNNNSSLLPGNRLEYLFNDTRMSSLNAINAMTSQYGAGTVGFIGPDVSCMCESTVAAAWNLPIIGYKCHDSKFGKQDEPVIRKTFARTQPSTAKVSKSIISLLQNYNWKRFTLVVGKSAIWDETAASLVDLSKKNRFTLVVGKSAIWNETAASLVDLSKKNNIFVNKVAYFKEPYAFNDEMYSIVETTHLQTRIYVFLGDYHGLIDFARLLKAILKDSMSEYVVIAMDEQLYTDNTDRYIVKTPFEMPDEVPARHFQSFETVLLLVPRPPVNKKWEPFLDKVREANARAPINGHPPAYHGIKISVPIYSAYLYDAVYTYALALKKVLTSGGDPKNGSAVIQHILNTTFTSILGYEVYVDKNGDAEGNYTVLSFDVNDVNGDAKNVDLFPVGDFLMTQSGIGIPALNVLNKVRWKTGSPPLDEPVCGFDGEKCKQDFDWSLLAVILVVVTVSLIAGGFFLRHYLYEQKLARLLWKVDFKDITLVDSVEDIIPTTRKKRNRSKADPWKKFILSYDNESDLTTLLEESKREVSSGSDHAKRNLIGSFKGTIVSVKHLVKKSVDIDRDLKKQLQLRKELNHDNIARFVGACIETNHVYILTQYCQRGSLKDILGNQDVNLDDMFISSLLSDLISGMTFIHDSEINTHGNLKPANCLVDSRWVLMVSDFGLTKLVSGDKPGSRSGSTTDMRKYYDKLLWLSPELLRQSPRDPAGTQKGDVYAFAFILYEMIGRKGAWGEMTMSSREIIEGVKNAHQQLRPDVTWLSCEAFVSECIRDCWHEDPEQRPDFKYVRFRLKQLLQGKGSNIFDNMLAMMEKYSNNLEDLVTERTELLSQEKKMTENLLLRMLPRFVAERLKLGEPVVPEIYECVSIYFSDIVGFTALSAESTPLEVVCMLNDLYTCFDAIIESYDVYKIETIGDAYFVVSGLPVRNENLHAGEIASMSLHMLKEILNFKIRHRPNHTLKLRIGLHSGACVAGVVGLKMPRYTLFGDTVNTASRMESTGVPLKIHCSETITGLLRDLGGYSLVERGYVTAKGKGEMLTYFLEGEDASHRQRRISQSQFHRNSINRNASVPIFGAATINPNKAICDSRTQYMFLMQNGGASTHCNSAQMSHSPCNDSDAHVYSTQRSHSPCNDSDARVNSAQMTHSPCTSETIVEAESPSSSAGIDRELELSFSQFASEYTDLNKNGVPSPESGNESYPLLNDTSNLHERMLSCVVEDAV